MYIFICFSLPSPLAVIVTCSCEQNISKQDINNTRSLDLWGQDHSSESKTSKIIDVSFEMLDQNAL